MNESEKQFSFTRAASSTSGRAKKQIPISISCLARRCSQFFIVTGLVLPALPLFPTTTYGLAPEVVHAFSGTNGACPMASLIQDSNGNFYGTTERGGDAGYGTVFRLTASGVLTTLVSFGNTNGAYPEANLLQASDGNSYGTASAGGDPHGYGTIFRLTTNGVMTSLVSFRYTNGSNPQGGLIEGSDGYLYGTTAGGGVGDAGTVFRLLTNGNMSTLWLFGGTNGMYPYAGVIQANDGNLYGTTRNTTDGGFGYGTAFRLTTNGVLTRLATFDLFNTGGTIYSGLLQGDDGNLYGTTLLGGDGGVGTAFRLTLTGELTPWSRLIVGPAADLTLA